MPNIKDIKNIYIIMYKKRYLKIKKDIYNYA